MLQTLRVHAGSWFIKVLFAVLVLSFALWGVGDVLRNYNSMRPVISVGGFSVSLDEFMHTLRDATSKAQTAAKGKLSPEDLQNLKFEEKIVEEFVDKGLIYEEIEAHRIVVPDETLTAHLHAIPAFQNEKGRFDPRAFRGALNNTHMSESGFIAHLRQILKQRQLMMPYTISTYLPQAYRDILFQGITQDLTFTVVDIPFSKMTVTEKPTDDALKLFYDHYIQAFQTPEMRSVTALLVDIESVRQLISLTDDQIREDYETRQADFTIPEQRTIKEFTVMDPQRFHQAIEKLRQGQPITAVARDVGGTLRDIENITYQDLPQDVAEKVFASDRPFFTEPMETSFGGKIFQIVKITPQRIRPLAEVREEISNHLRQARANVLFEEMRIKIEDTLAAGATFAEVAKNQGLKVITLPAFDQFGTTAEKSSGFPDTIKEDMRQKIIEQALDTPEGTDSPVVDVGDGNAFVIRVNTITPAQTPPFTAIREKVLELWTKEQQAQEASKLGETLAKAKSLNDFEQFARKNGLKTRALSSFNRTSFEKDSNLQKDIPASLRNTIFGLKLHEAVAGLGTNRVVVAFLTSIKPTKDQDPKAKEKFTTVMNQLSQDDIERSYKRALRARYTVSINQEMVNLASGHNAKP